jgi:hypothetical protein
MTFRGKLSRVVVLVGAAGLGLASLAGATTASAATTGKPLTEVSLFGGPAKFTLGGHTWELSVAAEAPIIAGASYSTVIGLTTANESDGWVFEVTPKADVSASASTGAFTLDSRSAFAPTVSVDVAFKATSHKAVSCAKGSETDFSGSLTGSVSLVANGKGLVFRSAHAKFRTSRVIVDRGCVTKGNPCSAGFWGADGPSSGSAGGQIVAAGDTPGLPGQRSYDVTIGDDIMLPAPQFSYEDIIVFQKAKSETYDSQHKRLTIDAGSGRVSGSVALTATHQESSSTSKCTVNGKSYKDSDVSYTASYASAAGHLLEAKSYVTGLIKMPASGSGEFDISTFKKA